MTDGESHIESTLEMYCAFEGTVALQMESKMRTKLNQKLIIMQSQQPAATDFCCFVALGLLLIHARVE